MMDHTRKATRMEVVVMTTEVIWAIWGVAISDVAHSTKRMRQFKHDQRTKEGIILLFRDDRIV